MRYARAVTLGVGCSAAIVAAYLLLREPASPGESARHAAAVPAIARPDPIAAPPGTPATAAPTPVRAAIAHALGGARLPRAHLERLAAGDVAGVARELAAAAGPAAAVELFDLAALCTAEGQPRAGPASGDEPAVREAAGLAPATRARLAALVAERHAWQERWRAGCAAANLEAPAIRARLAASAAGGDGASLERLARLESRPLAKLESAALLGNTRAAFRLALEALPTQASVGRSWLEAAARDDPEAQAYLGACLLAGCAGSTDPVAARQALELAARSGSLYALGVLGSVDAPDGPRRWVRRDDLVAPLLPHDLAALGMTPASGYAWAALATSLAEQGCFGFEFTLTAEALEGRAGLERMLRPGEIELARTAADELATTSSGEIQHALGCD